MLRISPEYFARFTALPLKRLRYCSSVRLCHFSFVIPKRSFEGWKAGSVVGTAKRFHGQASWQMSQP